MTQNQPQICFLLNAVDFKLILKRLAVRRLKYMEPGGEIWNKKDDKPNL